MKKLVIFEYKYEIIDKLDKDYWNLMGQDGWEMVHFRRPSDGGELIWKRKIKTKINKTRCRHFAQ
jgi:hypothetical protein